MEQQKKSCLHGCYIISMSSIGPSGWKQRRGQAWGEGGRMMRWAGGWRRGEAWMRGLKWCQSGVCGSGAATRRDSNPWHSWRRLCWHNIQEVGGGKSADASRVLSAQLDGLSWGGVAMGRTLSPWGAAFWFRNREKCWSEIKGKKNPFLVWIFYDFNHPERLHHSHFNCCSPALPFFSSVFATFSANLQ